MSEQISLTVSKNVAYVAAGVFFVIMISGYVANYSARSKLDKLESTASQCTEQRSHADEQLKVLQQKYNESSTQLTQITQENQMLLEKEKEFSSKLEALQIKYDVLSKRQGGTDTDSMPKLPESSPGTSPSNDIKMPNDNTPSVEPAKNETSTQAPQVPAPAANPEHPTVQSN